ncbi:MAG: AAA family ATPase [Nitrospira sp.]|nr:MAG: AAA family ATPase [Nitrospira sp.]
MFERFTDKGRKIIILAREEAERHQNDYLGTEHLVLAILRETDGIALMILKKMGLSTEQIRLEIERNLPGGGTTMTFGEIPFSPRVKKVIEYGVEEARLLGHNHIGSEHLLLGLLREEEGIGGKILRSLGANLLTARQLTVTFLRKSAPRERDRKSNTPALDEFGRDLTQLAQEGPYVVSKMTGIPLFKLEEEESNKLLRMEEFLHKRVIGQNEAISAVARAIRRSRAGLKEAKKPIGSFIFLGPTGVGKTELARTLAEFLFNSEDALIRIDMSEYQEKFTSSRLFGAPPGYVGYEEGGQLTEKVRRRPYSVVLFDEIEKAHPDVFNVLLQVLDDGVLTDSLGRKVDFKNTVVIMTSNIGTKMIQKGVSLGFQNDEKGGQALRRKEDVMGELKRSFSPEFLNRIDEIVIFHSLEKEHLIHILDILLHELNLRLIDKSVSIEVDDEVKQWLIKEGYEPLYGARPMRRIIQRAIGDPLSEELIKGRFKENRKIKVVLRDGAPAFIEQEAMAGV